MEPVLKSWPQKKRNLWFGPILLGGFLVGFILGGFLSAEFVIALLVGPLVGVGAAYALVGWPHLTTKAGAPLVPPAVKPWLWFAVAPVAALAAYVVLGVFLTPVMPPEILAYATLGAGVLAGGTFAYFVVGFPDIPGFTRRAWRAVPENRRPWLFFPLALVLGVLAYFLIGLAFTLAKVDVLPLEVQPLVALPVAAIVGAALAFLLVGFPKPSRPVREYVPDVPGRQRPAAFLVTWILLGLPFTYGVGVGLNAVDAVPHAVMLPLAFAVGYVLAAVVSIVAWGTPKRWREDPEYRPGIPESARPALFVPIVLVTALAGAFAVNMAGLDLFWGLVAGTVLGLALAVKATGVIGTLKRLRGDSPYLLPELPDKMKPLVLVPTWLVLTAAIAIPPAYALPHLLGWFIVVGGLVAFAVAVAVVEEPTLREALARRRAEKERARAFKARRREALQGTERKKA